MNAESAERTAKIDTNRARYGKKIDATIFTLDGTTYTASFSRWAGDFFSGWCRGKDKLFIGGYNADKVWTLIPLARVLRIESKTTDVPLDGDGLPIKPETSEAK